MNVPAVPHDRATAATLPRFSVGPMDMPAPFPDGIAPHHADGRGGRPPWLPLVVLGAIMLLALLGLLGGGKSPMSQAASRAASLEVTAPRLLRNGEFFEMRMRIVAHAPLEEAVLVIPASLWRDITINTMLPAAVEEEARDGTFRFTYGALRPGDAVDIKFDGQVNPPLFAGTHGIVALHDGERPLAEIPVDIVVLP